MAGDTADRLIAAGLVVVLLAAAVLLVLTGHDPTVIGLLAAGPAVSGLLGLVLVRRQSRVQATVQQVAKQTNGELSRQLAKIDRQTTYNGEKLEQVAAAGMIPPAAATTPTAQAGPIPPTSTG